MRCCFFCGEDNEVVLEDHHIIPRSLQERLGIVDNRTITLCRNCHKKLHYVLDPLIKIICDLLEKKKIEIREEKTSERRRIIDSKRIEMRAKILDVLGNSELYCMPLEKLAEETKLSLDVLNRIVDELVELGAVSRTTSIYGNVSMVCLYITARVDDPNRIPRKILDTYLKVKEYIFFVEKFVDNVVPRDLIEKAITHVRGYRKDTIRNWLSNFIKYGLIKPTNSDYFLIV